MAARLLLFANIVGIWAYIFWQGVYKFYVEAFGTWMVSPLILLRLSPVWFKNWLLRVNDSSAVLSHLVCLVPVLMFLGAIILGIWGGKKGSWPIALVACFLMTSIFVVYHSVKHLGMTYVVL